MSSRCYTTGVGCLFAAATAASVQFATDKEALMCGSRGLSLQTLLGVVILGGGGAQASGQIEATDRVSAAVVQDGSWQGTTAQSRPYGVTTSANKVTTIQFGYSLSGCSGTTTVTFTSGAPTISADNKFSASSVFCAAGSFSTSGTFDPVAGTASGTLTYSASFIPFACGCSGSSSTTWTAALNPPSALSINDVSTTEGNSGTKSLSFTVSLDFANASAVTVQYATADVADAYPATVGTDYQSASGTLTFAAGETSKTVTVSIAGDTQFEPNETFAVNLSGATNATIADNQGKGTITNDDSRAQTVFHAFFAVDTLETPFVGDFNGDAKTDIITFTRQNPTAIGDVYVALSTGTGFGTNTKWHDFFAITTDETVVIGDYDGDGKDDIATWLGKTSRQVYVAKSLGTGMTGETVWVNSIGSASTDYLAAGDANGDGKDDLIMFARTEGKVYVAVSDGTKFGTPTVWHPFFAVSTYERPRVADVNGDGKADIVTFATDSPTAFGDVYVAVSNGSSFRDAGGGQNSDKWHDFFAIRAAEEVRVGDLNKDGKDDFFTFLPHPFGQCYTVLSLGTSMAANVLWPQDVAPLSTDRPFVGDVNGDGKADIIIFAQSEGKVYVSLAS